MFRSHGYFIYCRELTSVANNQPAARAEADPKKITLPRKIQTLKLLLSII